MAIDFYSPVQRANGGSGGLNVTVSPLGIVELSDEEFQVHGPRLARYAQLWSWYLGYHWMMLREPGEPQLTYNWIKAFTDFICNFCFSRGVTFKAPQETSAIVPSLLNRVWTVDNSREKLLWEIGQMAGVTGDCMIKIAYEEPQMWPPMDGPIPGVEQTFQPGRVRILVLNSSYCFPVWNPHDRTKLIQFTQKYRFWCADTSTEALTRRGWKHVDDLLPDDEFAVLNPELDEIRWERPSKINRFRHRGEMYHFKGRGVDALTTGNHRWIVEIPHGNQNNFRYERGWATSENMPSRGHLVLGGGTPLAFRDEKKWSDELVETVAWYLCDGWDHYNQTGFHSIHLGGKKPHKVAAWRRLGAWWRSEGATWNENPKLTRDGQSRFYLGKGVVSALEEAAPGRQLTPEFICSLTYHQADLLYRTLLAGDGHQPASKNTVRWTQIDQNRVDGFQMLAALLGRRSRYPGQNDPKVTIYGLSHVDIRKSEHEVIDFDGEVWCPTTPSGTWLARRNGCVFWTGNSPGPDGTRQARIYTETITDTEIREYVDDMLIPGSPRPNPLGMIPVVHIPNTMVSGSPWGLSDCQDIITLNRAYNEIATEVLDIINYYTSPVTVVTGAAPNSLLRGSNNVWGLPKGAEIENLEGGQAGIPAAVAIMDRLKADMHALVGVPEGALGQQQPVSNTAGVALAIQYQPMMQRFDQKKVLFSDGFRKVNEIILRTLAIKEPEAAYWSPATDNEELKPGQLAVLDWSDPVTYQTEVKWPDPLPVDIFRKLQEIAQKMSMGLESKRSALAELGEEFPDDKLKEIIDELLQDAKDQGALDLLRAKIDQAIMSDTGMMPPSGAEPMDVASAGGPNVDTAAASGGAGMATQGQLGRPGRPPQPFTPDVREILAELNVRAAGTKVARVRIEEPTLQ